MKKVTDEDAGSTNNGHNSKGAAAWPPIGEGGLSHLPLTTSETPEEETKWRKFCRAEQMEEEEEGGNIRVCPAATTIEMATRTPAAPTMATTAGEWWRGPRASIRTQQTIDIIP
jgi:hypothetical protein